jgi:hypothetical protein
MAIALNYLWAQSHLTGHSDMRKGFDGLALLVQERRSSTMRTTGTFFCSAAGAAG